MKKISILVLMLMCAIATWAHDFEVDGIYYNKLYDGISVEVTSGTNQSIGDITIPSNVLF